MSDQNFDIEDLKDRLRRMLAKAEQSDNEHERDTFMRKVNELLEAHQIGIHEIRGRTGRDKDPFAHEVGTNKIYTSAVWHRGVAAALALYYGCEFIYVRKGPILKYTLVGRQSSRLTTELMLPYIFTQVAFAARNYMAEVKGRGLQMHERKATAEVGEALRRRILALVHANNAHRRDIESRALVPVDPMDEYLKQHWPRLRGGASAARDTTKTAREHADKISLHVQTEHDKKRMIT